MSRFTMVSAAHLFIFADGKVLLARRFNTGYQDGNYSVPAGHVDELESVSTAMIREAKEEIGIDIAPENLHFGHVMHRKSDRESVDFFFVCTQWQGEPHICEDDKCDELKWVAITDLPENTIPYVKAALEHVEKKLPYSEFGWDD